MHTDTLDAAINYLLRGFSVIPVVGKEPALITWQRWQTNFPDTETVRGWFENPHHPHLTASAKTWRVQGHPFGVAIITGFLSGVLVVDVDSPEGAVHLRERGIPATAPRVLTSVDPTTRFRKFHVYVRHPGVDRRIPNNVKGRIPGCDIRGDGGYGIAPPSEHPSGVWYEWTDGEPPERDEIPNAPEWLLTVVESKVRCEASQMSIDEKAKTPTTSPELLPTEDDGDYWVQKAVERVTSGTRNECGFWLACQLRDAGFSQGEAEQFLLAYQKDVERRGEHPYTEREARASLREAFTEPARGKAEAQTAKRVDIRANVEQQPVSANNTTARKNRTPDIRPNAL